VYSSWELSQNQIFRFPSIININTTKVKYNSNCSNGSEAVPARPSRKARRRQSRALEGKGGQVVEIELWESSRVTS